MLLGELPKPQDIPIKQMSPNTVRQIEWLLMRETTPG